MARQTWDKDAADQAAAAFKTKLTKDMTSEQLAKLWQEHFMTSGHRRLADSLVEFWRENGQFGTKPTLTPAPPGAIPPSGPGGLSAWRENESK